MVRRVYALDGRAASGGRLPARTRSCSKTQSVAAARLRTPALDVLDVVPDGLGRDAEILGDFLVGLAAHEHEEDFLLALGQLGRQLARSLLHAVAGGREHRVDSFDY
jgi:hypothetical protein